MDPERITYFAQTDVRARRDKFGIKARDRVRHMYVIGKTGMGKSTMLENLIAQDLQNGEGIAMIDPHGASAEKILDYIPKERINDVVYFAPFDLDNPIAFNVMEDVGYDKRHLVVSGLMSAFEKIWEDAWSARMEYILTNTLLALLEYPDSTMLDVNRMYSDKTFRKKVVDYVTDPLVKEFWEGEFANFTDRYAQEATPAIQNKVGQFTGNPLIRNIIGQSKSSFDIRDIIDNKKILICNLSKGLVGETNANLLGSMLITKIYLAAMSRADVSEKEMGKLPNFYFYVDEFQSFANRSFADILSEARKYKLNLTIAHQYIEQMSDEVRAAVFGNVGTMITFRVGAYDADVLEKEFAPQFYADDLVNLGKYQIYLKLMIDEMGSKPFSATTLPPIEQPEISYKEQVIDASRESFAIKRKVIEEAITKEHTKYEETRKEAHKEASAAGQKKSSYNKGDKKSTTSKKRERAEAQKQVFTENEHSNHKNQLADIAASMGVKQKENKNKDKKPYQEKKNNLPPKKEVNTEKNKADLKSALADVLKSQKSEKQKSKESTGSQDRSRGTKQKAGTNQGEIEGDELKKVLDVEGDKT